VFTVGLGWLEGGQEGPCSSLTEFVNEYEDVAAGWRIEHSLWPPGTSCAALRTDGTVIAERTYPEAEDWALAVILFVAPLALWGVWGRLRRRS
jgi:hypothetical protein